MDKFTKFIFVSAALFGVLSVDAAPDDEGALTPPRPTNNSTYPGAPARNKKAPLARLGENNSEAFHKARRKLDFGNTEATGKLNYSIIPPCRIDDTAHLNVSARLENLKARLWKQPFSCGNNFGDILDSINAIEDNSEQSDIRRVIAAIPYVRFTLCKAEAARRDLPSRSPFCNEFSGVPNLLKVPSFCSGIYNEAEEKKKEWRRNQLFWRSLLK